MKVRIDLLLPYLQNRVAEYMKLHTTLSMKLNPSYKEKLTPELLQKFQNAPEEEQRKIYEELYEGLKEPDFTEEQLLQMFTITPEELKQFFYD